MSEMKSVSESGAYTTPLQLFLALVEWGILNPNEIQIEGNRQIGMPAASGPGHHIHFRGNFGGQDRFFYLAGDTKRDAIVEWMKLVQANHCHAPELSLSYQPNKNGKPCLRLTSSPVGKASGWNCREI